MAESSTPKKIRTEATGSAVSIELLSTMATEKQFNGFEFGSLLLGILVLIAGLSAPAASTQAGSANFAAPPIHSVAGTEVGITGINSMAKGDFNGDGIPDIAVAGFGGSNGAGFPTNSIAVYLGNGDGTFKPPVY